MKDSRKVALREGTKYADDSAIPVSPTHKGNGRTHVCSETERHSQTTSPKPGQISTEEVPPPCQHRRYATTHTSDIFSPFGGIPVARIRSQRKRSTLSLWVLIRSQMAIEASYRGRYSERIPLHQRLEIQRFEEPRRNRVLPCPFLRLSVIRKGRPMIVHRARARSHSAGLIAELTGNKQGR